MRHAMTSGPETVSARWKGRGQTFASNRLVDGMRRGRSTRCSQTFVDFAIQPVVVVREPDGRLVRHGGWAGARSALNTLAAGKYPTRMGGR